MWVRFVCVSYKLVNLLRNRTFEPLMRSSFFPPLNTRYWYEILMASGVKLIMMKLVSFPWAIITHFQLISRQWPFIYNFLSTTICILFRNYVRHILEKLHSVMLSFVIAHICAHYYFERNLWRTDNSILSPHFRRQIRFNIATCVDVSLGLRASFPNIPIILVTL